MEWLVFTYSFPSKLRSSPRVTLWRRLGRLGAISPTGGLYVLPQRDECLEAFQWLAQEIRQAKGEAVVMRVEQFEGQSDRQLISLFNEARSKDYATLGEEAAQLEKQAARAKEDDRVALKETLNRLRRQQAEIARVDYFGTLEGPRLASQLARISELLSPSLPGTVTVAPTALAEYRDKRWVTRPRPHVDRLSCIWLIRRFVNPNARVRYSLHPEPDEVPFDMNEGEFGHQGNLCTFETILIKFGLEDASLRAMAEIIHEIDLRDGKYSRPATEGVDRILHGWLRANFSDAELEAHGVALFEGLYQALSEVAERPPSKRKR